ncbi:MAG: hypothetical protein ACI8WB_001205 [Phenylobacterium sp.]|jgi:hypothetical protein
MSVKVKMKDSQPQSNETFNFDFNQMELALKGKKNRLPRVKTVAEMDKWLEKH